MNTLSTILLVVGLGITLLVLFAGLIVFARGGETNRKWGNKLMRMRVGAQAFAIVLLLLAMWLRKG